MKQILLREKNIGLRYFMIFKIIFIRNYNQTYKIKKINNFETKDYPMIIASPEDLQK